MRTVCPADWARPGTIRRKRRECRSALADYQRARAAFMAVRDPALGDRQRWQEPCSRLLDEALEARQGWHDAASEVEYAERIKREMADGTRDNLGRPVAK